MDKWRPKRGDLVVVWKDGGEALITRVRDAGDNNGVAVVWCAGVSGFYAQHCVRPATFHESARVSVAEEVTC
jgi:hypothetical protein